MAEEKRRPDWVPSSGGNEFATHVMKGVEGGHDGLRKPDGAVRSPRPSLPRRRRLSVDEYVRGVLRGDRNVLAQAITLVESNAVAHMEMAQEVLGQLLPHTGRSIRVGVTGVPGVGKSAGSATSRNRRTAP